MNKITITVTRALWHRAVESQLERLLSDIREAVGTTLGMDPDLVQATLVVAELSTKEITVTVGVEPTRSHGGQLYDVCQAVSNLLRSAKLDLVDKPTFVVTATDLSLQQTYEGFLGENLP